MAGGGHPSKLIQRFCTYQTWKSFMISFFSHTKVSETSVTNWVIGNPGRRPSTVGGVGRAHSLCPEQPEALLLLSVGCPQSGGWADGGPQTTVLLLLLLPLGRCGSERLLEWSGNVKRRTFPLHRRMWTVPWGPVQSLTWVWVSPSVGHRLYL